MDKKILCLSDSLGFRGGAERQLSGLAFFLAQKGYDVQVATYIKQKHPSVLELNYGMQYYCIPNTGGKFAKLMAVYQYIKKGKYDVVIAYKNGPIYICSLLKMFGCRFKFIASDRNTDQKKDLKVKMKMFLYRYADYIVPNSYSQEAFIKTNYPRLSKKVHTIINYLDVKRFTPLPYENKDSSLKCIVVASIKKQKNPLNFIKAIGLLKQANIDVVVDWYGIVNDEDLYKECDDLINGLGIEDIVKIIPPVTNIHEVYPLYELYCLPSYFEGFPNTLCEAMSCGLPVIASKVCDNPYILDNGKFGILFNPSDPQSIADAFRVYLTEYRQTRESFGGKNRERIHSLCAEDAFVGKYQRLIEK